MNRKFGWKRQLPDKRDFRLSLAPRALPTIVDLTGMCPPIKDQGQLGSCTANAITSAMEFCRTNDGAAAVLLSRLFLYYNERAMEGTVDSDAGAEIRDGIKSANKQGICPESVWPYNEDIFAVKPNRTAYKSAQDFEAVKYLAVDQTRDGIRGALALGFPVVLGITVYDSFPMDTDTGEVPMPDVSSESVQGGHAIYLTGYRDQQEVYTFANSWGTGWGNGGFGTLPYEYIHDSDLCSDLWVIDKTNGTAQAVTG